MAKENVEDWCDWCSWPRSTHRWQELIPSHTFVSGIRAEAYRDLMLKESRELTQKLRERDSD